MSAEVVSEDALNSPDVLPPLVPGQYPLSPKKTRKSWQSILNTPLKL